MAFPMDPICCRLNMACKMSLIRSTVLITAIILLSNHADAQVPCSQSIGPCTRLSYSEGDVGEVPFNCDLIPDNCTSWITDSQGDFVCNEVNKTVVVESSPGTCVATQVTLLEPQGGWKLASQGVSCTQYCDSSGCSEAPMNAINSEALISSLTSNLGRSCNTFVSSISPGAPNIRFFACRYQSSDAATCEALPALSDDSRFCCCGAAGDCPIPNPIR